MNYVNEQNMQEILDGIARKIGTGGSGAGLEDWQASHEYAENDICVYNGQIYKAIVGFESDTTFSTTQILESYTLQSGDVPIAYAQGTDISIDDIVSYDGNYYKALYDFTCGDTFGLYALEEYTPKELTTAQEQQIVQHWQEYLGTGSGSSESSPTHYSTTEKMVGTWIDGKPLYQKTFVFNSMLTIAYSSWTQSSISISDNFIESIISVSGFIYNSGTTHVKAIYPLLCSIDSAFTSVAFQTPRNSATDDIDGVTLQYTKTTD